MRPAGLDHRVKPGDDEKSGELLAGQMTGALAANVMHFARMLRRAGLPVTLDATVAASEALTLIDIGQREQARAALRAVMVRRHDQEDIFDQAFALFWRDPVAAQQAAALSSPQQQGPARPEARAPPPAGSPKPWRRPREARAARGGPARPSSTPS